jgi:hypothetical protein
MISKYISFRIFLLSFVIGCFFVYLFGPERKEIYIYPSPENIDKILYKDNANNCFSYEEREVKCPKDNALIQSIPIQN